MIDLVAGVDLLSGQRVTEPALRFRAAMLLEDYLKQHPEMQYRVELKHVESVEPETYAMRQRMREMTEMGAIL